MEGTVLVRGLNEFGKVRDENVVLSVILFEHFAVAGEVDLHLQREEATVTDIEVHGLLFYCNFADGLSRHWSQCFRILFRSHYLWPATKLLELLRFSWKVDDVDILFIIVFIICLFNLFALICPHAAVIIANSIINTMSSKSCNKQGWIEAAVALRW